MLRMAPLSKNWTFEFTLSGIVTGMNPSTPPKIVATMLLPQGKELILQLKCGVGPNLHFGHYHTQSTEDCYYWLTTNDRVDYPISISAAVEDTPSSGLKYVRLSGDISGAVRHAVKFQPGNPLAIVELINHTPPRDGRNRSATFKLVLTVQFPQSLTDDADVLLPAKIANLRIHADQIESLFALGEFVPKDCKVVSTDGKDYGCHKAILALKSEVFKMAFDADLVEGKTNQIQIDADSDIVDLLIPYLYAGKVPQITKENAMELYRLAHLYHIEGLRAFVAEEIMLKANQLVEVANVLEMVVFAENFDLKVFKQFCLEFINGNRSGVVNLAEWEDFISAHSNLVKQLLLL